ncbi:MAG: carbamoyltransferase HypF [Solirubrobacteraceae bacterium]
MSANAPPAMRRRIKARVEGTVQGVGFRPYVYRLAGELELSGFVLNDAAGVLLEVEGNTDAVDAFLARLESQAPPLALVERIATEDRRPTGEAGFTILASPPAGTAKAAVAPDSGTCTECLAELFDPRDRRFRYPFINCTNCGPRFTIVRGVPYDRPRTTMASFVMCPRCRAEYEDPGDRRFHAQPNACPDCGPSLRLIRPDGAAVATADPLAAAAVSLWAGRIVAIKGIGGYHIACRADDEHAVAKLRARKHRADKPFALMAGDLAAAHQLVSLGAEEHELLVSPSRPIVLAPRRRAAAVAGAVAPRSRELGVMLPYSPLHHLLLADLATPIVLTSGNRSDEPIAYRDEDALERLGDVVDLFLVGDRPIETRTDDSVLRVLSAPGSRRTATLRRSRGYVPASLPLPGGTPRPLLACGAELNNTFCVAKGERAWVSHHVGDLENYETLSSFTAGIEHFERLFAVAPTVVAHDLHPEYLSTKYALERDGVELIGVQHHHAHLAACLAEHGETGPAVGAIFDGTGLGSDGTLWGGELLYGDITDVHRVGALLAARLPGGSQAVRQPWRMACAWLSLAGDGDEDVPVALAERVERSRWSQVRQLVQSGVAAPATTSVGRLFDAVAALSGLRTEISYEGQAAIELEAACDPHERGSYPIDVNEENGQLVIDPRETIRAVSADAAGGTAVGVIAARFHAALAHATVDACVAAASKRQTDVVVLSGGVFQNKRLAEAAVAGLATAGLRVLMPELLPAGDGGISYGQAAVAAHRMAI